MSETENNEEISLKDLIEKSKEWFFYLLSKWKIIFLAGFIGASLGVLYSISKKPIYKASLSFALEDEGSGSGGLGGALGLASAFGFDLGGSGGGAFTGSNLIELFKSRKMIEQTLLTPVNYEGKKISLAEMYLQVHEIRKDWEKKPKIKNLQFLPEENRKNYSRVKDSILGSIYSSLLKGDLEVSKKDKKIDITTIEVSSTNELFAANFTEALAKEVSDFYVATKSKKAKTNMDILVRQRDSIRNELNAAITGVAVANDNTFGLNPSMNIRRTPSAKKQVDLQANTAILTELVKQTELAKITLRKETPLIQVIDRPILPLEINRIGKLKGIIIGFFLGGILIIFFLVLKKMLRNLI